MRVAKILLKNLLSVEMLLYMLFGVGTFAIDYLTEILLYNTLPFSDHTLVVVVANCVSFVLSVTFAFVTNKRFVFRTKRETRKELRSEACKFFSTRIFTFILSLAGMILLVDNLHYDNDISKIAVTVVVIILNYLFSKLLIFQQTPEEESDSVEN